MDAGLQRELTAYLGDFVSERRKRRMEEVLAWRTRCMTVVLEDIYQSHNASAVLRSCECFGVQDVHIIESRNAYCVNVDIDVGASGWLTLHKYRDVSTALAKLKDRGYRLVAATPHRDACTLEELGVDQPLAVALGTEELGLSAGLLAVADEYVRVPMYGFTESFNISVCAALILRELIGRLHRSARDWRLTSEEKDELRLHWYRHSVRGVELIEERFLRERP
jgi:tRNA (guanosine-2'-O-)-methyltransferase